MHNRRTQCGPKKRMLDSVVSIETVGDDKNKQRELLMQAIEAVRTDVESDLKMIESMVDAFVK